MDIQVWDNYLFVTFGAGQIRVIDISDPMSPKEIAPIEVGGFAISLTLKDDYLYVSKAYFGINKIELNVVDISNLDNPLVAGTIPTESSFYMSGTGFSYYYHRPQVTGNFILISGHYYFDIFELK